MTQVAVSAKLPFSIKIRLWWNGWRTNRNVWHQLELPNSFEVFDAAKRILAEFGMLRFGTCDSNLVLLPAITDDEAAIVHRFETVADRGLYPIGVDTHQDRIVVLVDRGGAIFGMVSECRMPNSTERCLAELWLAAGSFEEFITKRLRPHSTKSQHSSGGDKIWELEV